MNKPIKVGITGGIGSGKTLISKIFAQIEVPVYQADDRAKELMHTELKDEIIDQFGKQSYIDERLNRDYLAQTVFNNEEQLKKLNAIVHPAVGKDFEKWVFENSEQDYVLKEAALLIEAGSYKQLDFLIVVTAPEALRVERIKKRDPFRSEDEIKSILSNQLSDGEREKLADFVIVNDERILVIPQVMEIDKKIRQYLVSTASAT